MEAFNVKILAADHIFYEGECLSLSIPAVDGMYGIRAHHSNLITAIVPGIMSYTLPGEEKKEAAVSLGCVKIEDGEVLVMVDTIERPEEIDVKRLKSETVEANFIMEKHDHDIEFSMAQATLQRVRSRMRLVNKHKIT